MCGVIGLMKNEVGTVKKVLSTLKRLEYRGYDSSGIAMCVNGDLKIIKEIGKIENLEKSCNDAEIDSKIAIGHTRWATHGKVTQENAHPHFGKKVAVIHNGIIENYSQIKSFLESNGVSFKTQTDTEVIPLYIEYFMSLGDDFKESFKKTVAELKGAYAIIAICSDNDQLMAFAKQGSPLVAGFFKDGIALGSDAFSLIEVANQVSYFKDGDWGFANINSLETFDKNGQTVKREIIHSNLSLASAGKDGYKHFMLKEINDQPNVLTGIINAYLLNNIGFDVKCLEKIDLSSIKRIEIIACGTSHYAGLSAGSFFEKYAKINCESHIASEFRYQEKVIEKDTLYLAISQSGETADTIGAIKYVKSKGATVLSLVNADETSMEQMSDGVMKLNCGPEISVASTKVFNSQIICIEILALQIALQKNHISFLEIKEITNEWHEAISDMSKKLHDKSWIENITKIAKSIHKAKNMIYLGRGVACSIALEGSLKMKELSYIHSEAMPAGELKHGPIALIEENTPVVCLIPDDLFEKMASNIENVFSRNGRVILIGSEEKIKYFEKFSSQIIGSIPVKDVSKNAISITYSLPLQLLSYYTALENGCDVDQPRNLAKSVTVE